ncbi:hypothetical protein EG68_01435 [Paragonimus skrjabini miyazakii]|uniref:Trematode PH-like domain-containing protein n=1 Tax=Paragonimus skrjabini miyazakii TaxID=59628 RepID=A0A8S9Z166_9TREM|nr:hypothetical protein EG68_01435 [Paragonimus skrjabini miyazakii]
MPRGRSRSRSRKVSSYPVEGNQLVDAKSKQLLFKEFELSTMGRTVLKGNEIFTEGTAISLLETHLKKKKKTGMVNFLVDRIRFGKKSGSGSASYREYLTYREIKQCYQFPTYPATFMLCVDEEFSGKRSYETYMCNSQEDTDIIIDLIRRAASDPQFLLHQQTSSITRRISSSSSDTLPLVVRPNGATYASTVNGELPKTRTVFSTYEDPVLTVYETSPVPRVRTSAFSTGRDFSPLRIERIKKDSFESIPKIPEYLSERRKNKYKSSKNRISPVNTYTPSISDNSPIRFAPRVRSTSPIEISEYPYRSTKEITIYSDTNRYNGHQPRKFSNSPPRALSLNPVWKSDITYLSTASAKGPQVTDRGSVFMYATRVRRPEKPIANSSESINDDSFYR